MKVLSLLVLPGDRQGFRLAGAHARAGDVVGKLLNRPGKGTHHPFVINRCQPGQHPDAGLPASVRQPSDRVFYGHGTGQARHLAGCDIGPHPDTTDRRAERDVVDDHDRLDPRPHL
jgi:hypothetical protein